MQSVRLLENKPSEWLAHRFYVIGQYEMCLNIVEQILRKAPDNAEALSLKGSVLRSKGDIDEALNCFQSAHNLDSENTRYLLDIAKCLHFLGRYQQSLKVLDQFEGTDDRNTWEVCQLIGLNMLRLKKIDEAKNAFQEALDIDYRLETVLDLINIYENEKNSKELEAIFVEALKYHENNPILRKRLAKMELRAKKYDSALTDFKFVCSKDPKDHQSMLCAAAIEQENQKNDAAMTLYRRAFVDVSVSAALWNNVALCLQARSRKEAVITCCRRAMFYAPFESLPVANMGLVFLDMGMFCSAAIALKRAKTMDPANQAASVGLAVALMNIGDYKEAVSILKKEWQRQREKKEQRSRRNHGLLINMALALYRDDKKDDAKKVFEEFQKVIDQEPAFESLYPISTLRSLFNATPLKMKSVVS